MRDRGLLTIILIIVVLALLDWLGVSGHDLIDSVRRLANGGENRLLGWAVLALDAYAVYRIINHVMRP